MSRAIQIEVRTVEEHASVSHTARPELAVCDCSCPDLRVEHAMHIVIVARDALAFTAQDAAIFEPVPQTVYLSQNVRSATMVVVCSARNSSRGTSSAM